MRILLVDDEAELIDPLGRQLQREGYQVDIAYDGETAIQYLKPVSPYQLLVLDWMLPHHSGIEICEQLRAQGDPTPVLFLTAKDTIDDRVKGLDAGADDYLIKPFELRELLARVRALLRRPSLSGSPEVEAALPDPRWQAADLALDAHNRRVYRQGKGISLSEKETRLLGLLMAHPDQVLTHEQISHHLWPEGEKPSSNVLAAQIRLLRRKIEQPGSPEPLIHTLYGRGYRFGSAP